MVKLARTPKEVKKFLIDAEVSQMDIARALNMPVQNVNAAINGHAKYRRVWEYLDRLFEKHRRATN